MRAIIPARRVEADRMATIEALCNDIVAEQAQQRAVLSSILRLLERGRGPRDAADVALLMAVAEAVGDRPFTSAALIVHAQADPALREALEAADITSAHEAGCVFCRLDGMASTGFRLERVGVERAGIVWQLHVCED